MIYPSELIPAATLPPSFDDVWEPTCYFPANWTDSIKLESEFTTIVRGALTDSEERTGTIDKPYRTLTVDLMSYTKKDSLLLHDFVMRTAYAKYLLPLYCDQTILLNNNPSNSLTCDTKYRRFYTGGRLLILDPSSKNGELGVINTVSESSISLSSTISKSFTAGAFIFPVLECRADVSQNDAKFITDQVVVASLTAQENYGRMALPAIVQSVSEYPLFSSPLNWDKEIVWKPSREGEYEKIGKDKLLRAYGPRPKHSYSLRLLFATRKLAWDYITFFNHRKGKLKPFWFPSPGSEYAYISHTTNTLTVSAVGEVADWKNRPAIAIEDMEGNIYTRNTGQVIRNAGSDTVTLSSPLPSIAIKDVRLCSLARFDQDDIEETWETTEVMTTKVKIIEIVNEKDISSDIQPIIPELA